MPFRCVDCKEEDRFVIMEAQARICVWEDPDGFLRYELDTSWDSNEFSIEDFRCYYCGGKVKRNK